ncbi:MAG TPA: hypothetical protein VGG76_11000 [Gemmatimonadaceae bacterium]
MIRALRLAIVGLLLGGCATLQQLDPQVKSDWARALYYARTNVDSGNYFAAGRILDEFARTHPGTREAQEITFWKAAYLVDPANAQGSLSSGIAALDGYLAADSTGWYRNEAIVLRRTAAAAQGVASQSTAVVTDTATQVVRDTVVVGSKSRDEQIAALKDQLAKSRDELAKVSAELDRIKKRLANPSN